jgi:hypothetical protein
MTDFTQILMGWETFYLLTGTAAATLIGLLFIAISINIDIFRGDAQIGFQHFATLTFNCFFYVLFTSMLFLIPGLGPLGLGIPLLALGLLGLANALLQQRRTRRTQSPGTDAAARFTVPSLCLLGMAAVGVMVIVHFSLALYGLVPVVFLLLASASVNAWTLLVRPARRAMTETDGDRPR